MLLELACFFRTKLTRVIWRYQRTTSQPTITCSVAEVSIVTFEPVNAGWDWLRNYLWNQKETEMKSRLQETPRRMEAFKVSYQKTGTYHRLRMINERQNTLWYVSYFHAAKAWIHAKGAKEARFVITCSISSTVYYKVCTEKP